LTGMVSGFEAATRERLKRERHRVRPAFFPILRGKARATPE
jgi:hypothetical protein